MMKNVKYIHLTHPFEPLFDAESRILILGSFPSVKSREQQFFYGHPQNRFWKVTSAVMGEALPTNIEEKRAFLHKSHIALWDVIYSCSIVGSSDASIRDAVPTDLRKILDHSKVDRIFVNGKTAYNLYVKHQAKILDVPAFLLPSSSPANAAWTMDKLIDAWQIIRPE